MPPKFDPSEMLFSGEAETEVLRLAANKHLIHDRDYYHETADTVVEGFDPRTNLRLTMSGLRAWVARCEGKNQQDRTNDTACHTTPKDNQDRPVHNPRQTIHPRRGGPLFKHRQRSPD